MLPYQATGIGRPTCVLRQAQHEVVLYAISADAIKIVLSLSLSKAAKRLGKTQPAPRAVPGDVNDGECCREQKPGQRILQMIVGKIDPRLTAARPRPAACANGFEDHRRDEPEMIALCHRHNIARKPDAVGQIG